MYEELRKFKRYCRTTEFVLRIDRREYQCTTIDYSLDGICLQFMGQSPPLKKLDVITIKIEEPEIDYEAEVVWTEKTKKGLTAGFRRIGNIKGTCQDFRIPDVLIGLQRAMKTGVLSVFIGHRLVKIFFQKGDVIFANSSNEDDRFGEVLLKAGKITLQQFNEASMELKKTGKRLGSILIELGYLRANELVSAVKHQVEEIIISVMTLECGYFHFEEEPLESQEQITLDLSTANLIYRSIRRITNFQYILSDLPSMDSVLMFSQVPVDLFQDIDLAEDDRKILSLITGNATVLRILEQSPLNDFESIKTLYALLSARLITVRRKDEPHSAIPLEEVMAEPLAAIDCEFGRVVHDMAEMCEKRNYYEVLGVPVGALTDEIKVAYFRLVKEFHPDRHYTHLTENLKMQLAMITNHLTRIWEVLSDEKKRRSYDESIAIPRQVNSDRDHQRGVNAAGDLYRDGRSKMLIGQYEKAEQLFAQAIDLQPEDALYHYYHGISLLKIGSLSLASHSFEQAARYATDNANYFAALGHSLSMAGRSEEAFKAFRKALSIEPDNESAQEGLRRAEN